jgi:hypothetical protein
MLFQAHKYFIPYCSGPEHYFLDGITLVNISGDSVVIGHLFDDRHRNTTGSVHKLYVDFYETYQTVQSGR